MKVVDAFKVLARIDRLISIATEKERGGLVQIDGAIKNRLLVHCCMKVVDAFRVLARIDRLISIATEKEKGGIGANRRGNKKSLVGALFHEDC
ncbi:hypothetical protein [Bartonella grahamii]|uniref:hypothetical protein n=1 Tax=Bartonella grahamii TaxID=33045 RepID=UPI002E7BFA67|nr:hypothetical protein [Bartonella grahamii]